MLCPKNKRKTAIALVQDVEAKDIAKSQLDEFKASDWWTMAFEDLDRVATSSLKSVLGKMEQFKSSMAENLSPTELKNVN